MTLQRQRPGGWLRFGGGAAGFRALEPEVCVLSSCLCLCLCLSLSLSVSLSLSLLSLYSTISLSTLLSCRLCHCRAAWRVSQDAHGHCTVSMGILQLRYASRKSQWIYTSYLALEALAGIFLLPPALPYVQVALDQIWQNSQNRGLHEESRHATITIMPSRESAPLTSWWSVMCIQAKTW